jgi:hypothetical protein
MFRQQVAGLLRAVDDARREFAFAKITAHGTIEHKIDAGLIPAHTRCPHANYWERG